MISWSIAIITIGISSFVTFCLLTFRFLSLPSSYQPSANGSYECTNPDPNESTYKFPIQILVLGDIGHSPRMQYHALSCAKLGAHVQLIGYCESKVHPDIAACASIQVVPLSSIPKRLKNPTVILFPLIAAIKIAFQTLTLFKALGFTTGPAKWLMVQNPPSIPTLVVAEIISFLRNTKLIIDWHNIGHTVLATKLGEHHPLVYLAKLYERISARFAFLHICVTDAMRKVLKDSYNVTAITLHDRPATIFQPLTERSRLVIFRELGLLQPFSEQLSNMTCRLIVTSTSWTPDEDFQLLLDALIEYSRAVQNNSKLPQLLVIITGKGPLKDEFLVKLSNLNCAGELKPVTVKTTWLSFRDYASLLAAADLGISLHTSTSGLDLPMKVLDMFGCGVPVLGWCKYEAWPELVQEGKNGRGFTRANELAHLLVELLTPDNHELKTLRQGALDECQRRWDSEWNSTLGHVL